MLQFLKVSQIILSIIIIPLDSSLSHDVLRKSITLFHHICWFYRPGNSPNLGDPYVPAMAPHFTGLRLTWLYTERMGRARAGTAGKWITIPSTSARSQPVTSDPSKSATTVLVDARVKLKTLAFALGASQTHRFSFLMWSCYKAGICCLFNKDACTLASLLVWNFEILKFCCQSVFKWISKEDHFHCDINSSFALAKRSLSLPSNHREFLLNSLAGIEQLVILAMRHAPGRCL